MNNDPGYWPSNIIPTTEKERFERAKEIMDYAINRWRSNRAGAHKYFTKMENSYNGDLDPAQQKAIDTIYGMANRVKFVDFRISRNKLDTLLGEFLMRPIKAVVDIINREVSSERQERKNMLLGMYMMKDVIAEAKKNGIDLTGGMEVPESKEKALEMASYKNKAEVFFNRVCSQFFKIRHIQDLLHDNLRDVGLKSEAFIRVFINIYGEVDFMYIGPEDILFEEMKHDPFIKRTPYFGSRILMTKPEVLNSFDLSKTERDEIDGWFNGGSNYSFMKPVEGQPNSFVMEVFHLEWKWLEMWTLIKETDKKTGITRDKDVSHDDFVKNRQSYMNPDNPRYERKIDAKCKERTFEMYRLGGTIYKKLRMLPNTPETPGNPFKAKYSYQGLLFNTVGGKRVPFFALMEEAKWQYNWVRNIMNRELAKFKGTSVAYDRALMPVGKDGKPLSPDYIAWKLLNDGILDYSSVAEGNYAGKDIKVEDMFKPLDFGVTNSLQQMIQLAYDLEKLIDRLSSVNDNRQGLTSASETVANAENNIVGSRTITEPMMYFFDRFIENTILSALDHTRVWAKLNPESLKQFIGDDAERFFEDDLDISVMDLGVHVENTRVMQQIRQRIQKYMEVSINAGQLAIPDAFEVDVAETVAEAKAILRNSWTKIQAITQEQKERELQSQEAQTKALIDDKIQDREDKQAHDGDMVVLKGKVKSANDSQKAISKSREVAKT
jgi:hypothetical protein